MDTNPHKLTPEYLSQNKYPNFFASCTIAFAVCMSCIALRVLSSRMARKSLWLDDYAVIVAGICVLPFYAGTVLWNHMGFGRHVEVAIKINPKAVEHFFKSLLVLEIAYLVAMTSARLSIIAFLWRLFVVTSMRCFLIALIIICSCWMVALSLVCVLSCTPINAFWNLAITERRCVNYYRLYITTGASNLAIDLAIVILPIPYIARMKISWGQKVMVACTFIVAGVICIISAVRLSIIVNNFSFEDPTWDSVDLLKWSAIEMYCSVISVCLPAYRPLLNWIGKTWMAWRSHSQLFAPQEKPDDTSHLRINSVP